LFFFYDSWYRCSDLLWFHRQEVYGSSTFFMSFFNSKIERLWGFVSFKFSTLPLVCGAIWFFLNPRGSFLLVLPLYGNGCLFCGCYVLLWSAIRSGLALHRVRTWILQQDLVAKFTQNWHVKSSMVCND